MPRLSVLHFIKTTPCQARQTRTLSTYIQACNSRDDLKNASEIRRPTCKELPAKAKVVICGGGAQGAAIAYKLAEYGWGDGVLLLEQGELGGGTSTHATGLMGILKPSAIETRIAIISRDLYRKLEDKGWYTGFKTCGSLYVAKKKDRMFQYKRMKAASVQFGLESKILTQNEVKEYCGLIRTDDLLGGLWVPGDGVANPNEICLALGNEAMAGGVKVLENCEVKRIISKDGTVKAVETSHGTVECDYFVNSAGFWSRHVGEISQPPVAVPIHPAEHYHLHTKPVPDLPPDTPVVRDPDAFIYFR
ncbi:pyruvate dehydrogenase phosphatase regulatory subunit, mitochondrial, partial [Eurytemora carolleeae]|uniref:pyruvate dehydrogenase phosphatase regulatory subunit, mitochondrial n=1 Tax=Eurytemora carolleeae TaxID=1294199 RepID=UPI000C76BF49